MNTNYCNIAQFIPQLAEKYPDSKAIIYKLGRRYMECTFKEFEEISNSYAAGFLQQGIKKGTRVIMLVPHSLDFYLVMFSLFKVGAVPVVVDPGMRKKDMLICIKESQAEALIGIPLAHLLKSVFKSYFQSCNISIIVGKKTIWQGVTLKDIKTQFANAKRIMVETLETDLSAILFTSGSTGIAKGVEYEHGMFYQQVIAIQNLYDIRPGNKDLPCFPLFGLFSLAMGVTLILPDINPSKPAKVNPKKIVEPILKYGITNCFASPAIWNNVCAYCEKNKITLPSLRVALAAGAPIAGHIIKRLCENVLPKNGDVFTPYGATESLPVASISGRDRLAHTMEKTNTGSGICVGSPVQNVKVKIISIENNPIINLRDIVELPNGEIGEILVSSPSTTKQYFLKPDKTKLSKIYEDNIVWHRMGDVGYLDTNGVLWFCGRKDHRVEISKSEVLFTIPCEGIFNTHPKVSRTALVGIKIEKNTIVPVLMIELKSEFWKLKGQGLAQEILGLGQKFPHTKKIKKAIFYKDFPVDIRHNAKIDREYLAKWAQIQPSFFELKI
jgi:acyl-CoA synthetase (AMP-forming)/AMP-acid ligase II